MLISAIFTSSMNKIVKIQEWLHPPFDSDKKRIQEGGIGLFEDDCPSRKSWKKAIDCVASLTRIANVKDIARTNRLLP